MDRKTHFLAARLNPLSIERVTTLPYFWLDDDWDTQLDRLARLNFRAAIVGKKGSGKTTLLNALNQHLLDRKIKTHYVFIPPETCDYRRLIELAIEQADSCILLVDGIERIPFVQRFRLMSRTRATPGLIINVHRPCRLSTWIHCQTNPELLRQILIQLNLDLPSIQLAGRRAFQAHKGNIRLALRDLYDQFSSGKFKETLSL